VAPVQQRAGRDTETYSYDAAGRLTHIGRDNIEIQRRYYDGLGRLMRQETPQALADTPLEQGGGAQGMDNYTPPTKVSGAQGGSVLSACPTSSATPPRSPKMALVV